MRSLNRGIEPNCLVQVRNAQLQKLRALGREPNSKEISGYTVVAEDLWKNQHKKCCYCEMKLLLSYNDVEHYRPKATADRRPGCTSTHGYWWVAFTWENLLFSCPGCNRSAKRVRFPLANGTIGSVAEDVAFLGESPLLINPYVTNPNQHISFEKKIYTGTKITRWFARPRNKSILGAYTIDVCDLNRDELLEMRQDHWENCLAEPAENLSEAIRLSDIKLAKTHFATVKRYFSSTMAFSAFSYNVMSAAIPQADFTKVVGLKWPVI